MKTAKTAILTVFSLMCLSPNFISEAYSTDLIILTSSQESSPHLYSFDTDENTETSRGFLLGELYAQDDWYCEDHVSFCVDRGKLILTINPYCFAGNVSLNTFIYEYDISPSLPGPFPLYEQPIPSLGSNALGGISTSPFDTYSFTFNVSGPQYPKNRITLFKDSGDYLFLNETDFVTVVKDTTYDWINQDNVYLTTSGHIYRGTTLLFGGFAAYDYIEISRDEMWVATSSGSVSKVDMFDGSILGTQTISLQEGHTLLGIAWDGFGLCEGDAAPHNIDGTYGNGFINIDDIVECIGQMGADCTLQCSADTNLDGDVDIDDLNFIIGNFGICLDLPN